jgi:hypothetical protein
MFGHVVVERGSVRVYTAQQGSKRRKDSRGIAKLRECVGYANYGGGSCISIYLGDAKT